MVMLMTITVTNVMTKMMTKMTMPSELKSGARLPTDGPKAKGRHRDSNALHRFIIISEDGDESEYDDDSEGDVESDDRHQCDNEKSHGDGRLLAFTIRLVNLAFAVI